MHRARDLHEVLRRPGHAPRGDDRLLRAALIRPAPLPRARAARVVGPGGRVELLRHRAPEDLPQRLDLEHRQRDPHDPEKRDLDRDSRRRLPALVVALASSASLESAFNIVYGRPNRGFLRGKALAVVFMLTSLVGLFAGLAVGGVGAHLLNRFAPGILGNPIVAYHPVADRLLDRRSSSSCSTAYRYLTNARLSFREVLPGAIVATIALAGDVPGAAVLPAAFRARAGRAGVRRTGAAADLAVRDGERDRLRRRDQLAAGAPLAS